ncbi:M61 glycyl aminopeptidase family [Janthinobacterium sp. HH01]|uniref:M61 family metallopeptidase n=1 Tax=Janthinobacterium sp. HH01 TaxID=1198452 RepID=UPI0002AEB624|nr:M61 glycyl aminopeptidase family [Janthinobacterium sp. HH01]ELX13932.1 M61 glycyl aminopeptidase family [Janthinobacterium sp. HH01]
MSLRTTLIALLLPLSAAAAEPIQLAVDMRDAPRKLIHATLTIPVQPGPLTLAYPKWMPNAHAVAPIVQQTGLAISANGKPLVWRRDPLDLYSYRITVPKGVRSIEVKTDFITAVPGQTNAGSTSDKLGVLSWNDVLLYPYAGPATRVDRIKVTPSLTLPEGWHHASSLHEAGKASAGGPIAFQTVSLEMLVDSPLIAGRYFREVALAPEITPPHYLDMVADAPENLELSQAYIDKLSQVVRQTTNMFRSHHYDAFRMLVTLSDEIEQYPADHHQSLDNRRSARFFTDEKLTSRFGNFLTHDVMHSWSGKYRRPEGMNTPNFQVPPDNSGQWAYEGLTSYLGDVIATRSGLWNQEQFLGSLASNAAYFDRRSGRQWRDLEDTAMSAMDLWNNGGGAYDNQRRNGFEFYGEGSLIWLEVDVTMRNLSDGRKSLDDFLVVFTGGPNNGAEVKPYSFAQLMAALNSVVPNDWTGFFNQRLHSHTVAGPLGGITGAGYRLVYSEEPSAWSKTAGSSAFENSIGLTIGASGVVGDVLPAGVGDKAGFVPGMTITGVNGQPYTAAAMRKAIRDAKGGAAAIEVALKGEKTLRLDYHDGERFPVLERIAGTPDRLSEILQAR